jgi:hypothetical protein
MVQSTNLVRWSTGTYGSEFRSPIFRVAATHWREEQPLWQPEPMTDDNLNKPLLPFKYRGNADSATQTLANTYQRATSKFN